MGRKDVLFSYPMFQAVDTAVTVDTFTNPTNVVYLDNCGIQVYWDPTVDGELFVYASMDKLNPSNWTELDFGTQILINNLDTTHMINLNQVPFNWLALEFIPAGGGSSGNITAMLTSKMVG